MNKALVFLLSLYLSGCSSPQPVHLDLSLKRHTLAHKYVVAMYPTTESIALDQMHAWEVRVSRPSGEPVRLAQLEVAADRPQHGRGLSVVRPRATRELGGGRYLIEGMMFSRSGWWEIRVDVQTARDGADSALFNKVMAPAASLNA